MPNKHYHIRTLGKEPQFVSEVDHFDGVVYFDRDVTEAVEYKKPFLAQKEVDDITRDGYEGFDSESFPMPKGHLEVMTHRE